MEIISNPTRDEIKMASKALKDGHLVAFPTETVYGLGADATNEKAINRIYSVKGRPRDHPLIIHISSINQMDKWAIDIPEYAIKLAKKFWPGPMTVILKRSGLAKNYITGNQDTVGLRVPSHPVTLSLLEQFQRIGGDGVAAPSANKFGRVSPTFASDVINEIGNDLGKSDLILDGGQCFIGLESTIIDCTGEIPSILRPGKITLEILKESFEFETSVSNSFNTTRVSGLLEQHYAPKVKILLNQSPLIGQGYLALSTFITPAGVVRLASPKSLEEFARDLYASMRKADVLGLSYLVIQQPTGNGIAVAIRDRLIKAANGK
jgi:L-threonylcarbamoyladenylate synthase